MSDKIVVYFFQIEYNKNAHVYQTSITVTAKNELNTTEFDKMIDSVNLRLDAKYGKDNWFIKSMNRVQ